MNIAQPQELEAFLKSHPETTMLEVMSPDINGINADTIEKISTTNVLIYAQSLNGFFHFLVPTILFLFI